MEKVAQSELPAERRGSDSVGAGALYLVGTPIGNLEDITLRALRILRQADLIACEDTRHTQKLLSHFGIRTRTTSYHEHNEKTKAPELLRRLEGGAHIALVSDAGMPAISDPGYRLITLCLERGITVIPVPGPSAVLAALVASGLPTHSFQFLGFAPARGATRRKFLEAIRQGRSTVIFFEAPHRIQETLAEFAEIAGDRHVVVARELTKLHEEFVRGTCAEVQETLRRRADLRGEVTVVVGPAPEPTAAAAPAESLRQRADHLMQADGLSRMEALKVVARERKISKSQAYREYQNDSSGR